MEKTANGGLVKKKGTFKKERMYRYNYYIFSLILTVLFLLLVMAMMYGFG